MLHKYIVLLVAILLSSFVGFSQSELSQDEQKKILKQARNYLYAGEFFEAFPLYTELYKADTNNSVYNYELGICVYEGSVDKLASKKYFEKIVELNEREDKPELFYYLGRLYHLEHNFLYATGAYNTYLVEGLPPGKLGKEMQAQVESYILQCEDGKDLLEANSHILEGAKQESKDITKYVIDSTRYISFENLGEEMNSPFDDYGPIIMDNEEVLLITSRRQGSTGGELYSDGQYYEDIYIANFRNGIWSEINNINNTDYFGNALLNTSDHNATVSISPDESQLFIYTRNHCERMEHVDEAWQLSEKFSEKFSRAKRQVSNVTISPDGRVLYIEAERFDSYGGRDLYKSTLQDDGTWGEMQNLGPAINTEYEEVSPYLLNDTTLFFSSQGHSSIGGWDVFVTHKTDTGWSSPENLGIPINTPADEVNYMLAHSGSKAYYSSNREGGYGGFDIYTIVEAEERQIDQEMIEKIDKIDSLAGGILVLDDLEFDENGALTAASLIKLDEANEKMSKNPNLKAEIIVVSDDEKGLETAKSNAESAKKYLTAKGVVNDRVELRYKTKEEMRAAKEGSDAPLTAQYEQTIYFGSNSSMVTEYSQGKLQALLTFLESHPDDKIYLSGHTDHVGQEEFNLELSKRRAASVEAYLRSKGIKNPIRIEYFGESSPHFSVEEVSADKSKLIYNRRVKIVIF